MLSLTGPPDAPKIANVKVEGKTCTLQWTKPSDGQSPIETYTVSVWMVITKNGSEYKKRMGSWNTVRTKHDFVLKWNQNYTVAVSAWNSYGQSASSLHKQFKTDTKPEGKGHCGLQLQFFPKGNKKIKNNGFSF